MSNFSRVNTSVGSQNPIDVNLNTDNVVCGFSELISVPEAKKMVREYFSDFKQINDLINFLETHPVISPILSAKPEFIALKSLFSAANHTVSGVFGKEVILQLLAQKKCEGLRYLVGKYQNKPTVILIGVKNAETPVYDESKSEPVPDAITMLSIKPTDPQNSNHPSVAEVHRESLTVAQLQDLILPEGFHFDMLPEELRDDSNKLFSVF